MDRLDGIGAAMAVAAAEVQEQVQQWVGWIVLTIIAICLIVEGVKLLLRHFPLRMIDPIAGEPDSEDSTR